MQYMYATSKWHNLLDDDVDVPVSKVSSYACAYRVGERKSNKFNFDILKALTIPTDLLLLPVSHSLWPSHPC